MKLKKSIIGSLTFFVLLLLFTVNVFASGGVENRINSILAQFPSGSYFTANGQACNHSSGSTCSNCQLSSVLRAKGISFDSLKYSDGWTCYAFAVYCYGTIFEQNYRNATGVTSSGIVSSNEGLYNAFKQAKMGDFVYCMKGENVNHYAIFISCDASGVTLLHNNIGGNGKVGTIRYGYVPYSNLRGAGYGYNRVDIYRAPNYDSINGVVEPLSISNVRVSDVNSNSYKVSCNIAGNVTKVLFPTWPSADDSGNPIWHEGTISGNTASCVIRRSAHGNKTGDYISHIYIYDSAGNSISAAAPLVVMGDTQVPVISDIRISEIKMDSFTVTCKVYDNGGVTSVKFPTWPSADDSGNPIWHEGTINGDTASCVIKKSDHGNKTGLYLTHIYAYDMNGNMTAGRAPGVIIGDTEPPVIEDIKIIDVTEESYTITCTVKDNNSSGAISVRFPTWPSADDSGNPIWHEGRVNGDTASCVIKKSDHGNKTGTYISHIYAYDVVGNSSSAAAPAVELGKKHQHVYTSSIKKPATCTEPGIRLYTCKDNDDSYEEEIPAAGHQHTELRNVKAATCAQEGYTGDVYCQDCGKLLEEGQVIPKADHVWNKGEITTPATCTTKGIKTYSCASCGTTKTEAIAATGHGATEIRNKKDATTTSEGYTGDIYCTICNQKISSGKTIAKLTPQTATSGKTIKDKSTNGVYKVLQDGVSVEFTKPVYKKASVRIPDTIKVNGITCKVTGISANAFKNNMSLKSVTIGRNVTVIGTNAFYGCKKLSKVSGGNGIVKIDHRAFANCSSLSKITIPGSVRSVGKQAFCNCKKLSSITIKTSTLSGKTVGSKAFAGIYIKPTVKVPEKQMKAYKKLLKARGMSSKTVYRK